MKRLLLLTYCLSFSLLCFSQDDDFEILNHVAIADYQEVLHLGRSHLIDSIENEYGLRSSKEFKQLSAQGRDSLIGQSFSKFFSDIKSSYMSNVDNKQLEKGKYSFFANFCYDEFGSTDYIFYNWTQKKDTPEKLDSFLKNFMTSYTFANIPKGQRYCQCASYEFKVKSNKKKSS